MLDAGEGREVEGGSDVLLENPPYLERDENELGALSKPTETYCPNNAAMTASEHSGGKLVHISATPSSSIKGHQLLHFGSRSRERRGRTFFLVLHLDLHLIIILAICSFCLGPLALPFPVDGLPIDDCRSLAQTSFGIFPLFLQLLVLPLSSRDDQFGSFDSRCVTRS